MRRVYHENVQAILEELQGANSNTQAAGGTAMPTPGKPVKMAPGKPQQQVAAGAQQMAAGVQATAAQNAQQGDQAVKADMAHQQGIDPKQQEQVNKNLAAQPKPTKLSPTAASKGIQQDALQNRQQGASGRPVVQAVESVENATTSVEKIDATAPMDDAANPDDKTSFNDDPKENRAAERAKEIFPGAKGDNVPAGFGKNGAGRPQGHHEITNPANLTTKRSTELKEAVLSDSERTALSGLPSPQNPVKAALPPPTPINPVPQVLAPPLTSQPANAIAQAAGTPAAPGTAPVPAPGPKAVTLPSVVSRGTIAQTTPASPLGLDLSSGGSFEQALGKLLEKDLELAQYDRAMAISLFQVHLDRAEVLDTMQLSMPVATVIGDNTGATLKSLELAMKAGERVHKVAELLVNAQKNGDALALAALKVKQASEKGGNGWADDGNELPQ